MKKVWIIFGAVAMMAMAGCKKGWTCQCTDNNGSSTYHEIPNATLHDANQTCNSYEFNNGYSYNNCSVIQ